MPNPPPSNVPHTPLQQIAPTAFSVADMKLPERLDLTFEGWRPEAFAILERLRAHPHIDQYQQEKPELYTFLKEPFKRYRDDLAVNWVLPNRLGFETERNVFSRLLKNDFGAGGCHHHLWMSFYRPGRRRLTDVQLSHSLWPDGFEVGLFVGRQAKELFRAARAGIEAAPEEFLSLLNPLLKEDYRFYFAVGSGKNERREAFDEPLDALPEDVARASSIWLRRRFPKEQVSAWQGEVVRRALEAVREVWPLYRFLAAER